MRVIMRVSMLRRAGVLLAGTLLTSGTLCGCGHNPSHDVDMEKARAAANRVHRQPSPAERAKMEPGHGG
jgi:hypothetical protein